MAQRSFNPMKLLMSCSECLQELISEGVRLGSQAFEDRQWVEFIDVNDQGVYSTTCPEGHKVICGLSNRHYELLFDRAACAFVDGYYREAIATFASALERFFEFYIRVVARHSGIVDSALTDFWRPLGNRSERQLGAVYFAYVIQNKRAFPYAHQKMEELRNNVVHKGLFATQTNAFEFGEYVYDTIWALLEELQKASKEALDKEWNASYLAEVKAARDRLGFKGNLSGMGVATLIQTHARKSKSFADAIIAFERHNPWIIGLHTVTLGRLASRYGLTVRQFLRELASGKYASAFGAAAPGISSILGDVPAPDKQQAIGDDQNDGTGVDDAKESA
jgi:hypothetical protein